MLDSLLRISFVHPGALLLLAALLPIWLVALMSPRRLGPFRFWASLIVRTAVVVLLVLGLAGTQYRRPVEQVATVFVLDRSESIAPDAAARGEQFVREALQVMPPDDRAGVVLFGQDSRVEQPAEPVRDLAPFGETPTATRTNIEQATSLAVSLLPADANKRIVLLSDGGENEGDARRAIEFARGRNVEISYVDLGGAGQNEALVTGIAAPGNVRAGQSIELSVTVESSAPQAAGLRVFAGDQVLLEQGVELTQGTNVIPVNVPAVAPGFQRYRAELTPQADSQPKNNLAEALIRVDGPPRVLVVEGTPGEAQPLQGALTAAGVGSDVVAPGAIPADMTALAAYDALALVNVPANAVPPTVLENMPTYVRDLGRGLLVIGGDKAYGVGGYGATPLADVLPVTTDVPSLQERPEAAIIFVLDKSSSMDACHCRGPDREDDGYFDKEGPPKVDIAKEAIAKASALLTERDTLGVVAFDWDAFWAYQPTQNAKVDDVIAAIAPIEPKGGSNIYAGLAAAEGALASSTAKVKHAIIMTDGWTKDGDPFEVVRRMHSQGMTVSIVGDGLGAAPYLGQLAAEGGGRYFPVTDMSEVPSIYVQDMQQRLGNYTVETPFTPQYGAASPVLNGLENGLPTLYGYNVTMPKQTATVALYGLNDAPLLAQWQYGLGRVIAWTSDTKGQWAKDWIGWAQFPQFAAQAIGWTLPNVPQGGITATTRTGDGQLTIEATVPEAQVRDGAALQATLIAADGTRQELPLNRIGALNYEMTMPLPQQGGYVVQIVQTENGQVVAQTSTSVVVPYSAEYGLGQNNPALLAALAEATGGRALTQPAEAFAHTLSGAASPVEIGLPLMLAALLLLPLDVLLRRGTGTRTGRIRARST